MKKIKLRYHGAAILVVIGVTALVFYGIPYIQTQIQPQITPKPPPIIKTTPKPDPYLYLTKLIQTKQPKLDPAIAKEISKEVWTYSKKFKFPPELIICVIDTESSFKQMAISKAGCVGLMQINRKFHAEKLKKLNIKGDEIFYVSNNIHIGCMILREYFDSTKSISGALAKYLGDSHKPYILDILTSFTDLMIVKK